MTDDNVESMARDVGELPTDVRDLQLDLTPDQKLRTVALMLATRYYIETICKDADYLKVLLKNDLHVTSASFEGVIKAAIAFEAYLSGALEEK